MSKVNTNNRKFERLLMTDTTKTSSQQSNPRHIATIIIDAEKEITTVIRHNKQKSK